MIDAVTILAAWPVLISAAVGLAKKIAAAAGMRDSESFVRLLPMLPELMGVLSSPVAVYLFTVRVSWWTPAELQALPWWFTVMICGWAGIGAGAVSSKGWKWYKQSLRGEDPRL